MDRVVIDIAGSGVGGAARWAAELDAFRARTSAPVTVIGQHRRLTPAWLVAREWRAVGARIVVAANNASFAGGGATRRVVLRNALHFLYPWEEHQLAGMSRSFRLQVPVVHRLLSRADTVVVPSSAMADRVCYQVPEVRRRVVVRPHPVSPVGPRVLGWDPFVLVPVLPAPYKNLVPQLAALVRALDRVALPMEVRVTARPADLPAGLARHPRVRVLGTVPYRVLTTLWRRATAAFFPSSLEAFGYPLAEARVYGVPVLSPDTAQAREIAGGALIPYQPDEFPSLTAAVAHLDHPVTAEPYAFDRDAYFRWLLELPTTDLVTAAWRSDGNAS